MLSLIRKENSFQFNGRDYLQTHGTAMGTKMAVAFANIFMANIEKEILRQSTYKPLVGKRFIDDVFSLWNITKGEVDDFIEQANKFHPGEALRLLRITPSPPLAKTTFEANIKDFMFHLITKRYPVSLVKKRLGEVQFNDRHSALTQKNQTARKNILSFVTQYCPALLGLKDILREKWHLIQNHQRLEEFSKEPPLLSYRKGKSLKDILVKAKL